MGWLCCLTIIPKFKSSFIICSLKISFFSFLWTLSGHGKWWLLQSSLRTWKANLWFVGIIVATSLFQSPNNFKKFCMPWHKKMTSFFEFTSSPRYSLSQNVQGQPDQTKCFSWSRLREDEGVAPVIVQKNVTFAFVKHKDIYCEWLIDRSFFFLRKKFWFVLLLFFSTWCNEHKRKCCFSIKFFVQNCRGVFDFFRIRTEK